MPYQPGIPTGTVDLDVDYQNLQDNFTQLDVSFGVDHVPFSDTTPQNGYHTSIHFNPISTTATNPPNNVPPVTPAATVGYGQLFSCEIDDGINVDQALFWLTGGNRLAQLTRNFAPTFVDDPFMAPFTNPEYGQGSSFIPGGFIIKWGYYYGLPEYFSSSGTITFSDPFPSRCYGVNITPNIRTPVISPDASKLTAYQVDKNLFKWINDTSVGFFWFAIGN